MGQTKKGFLYNKILPSTRKLTAEKKTKPTNNEEREKVGMRSGHHLNGNFLFC
jgi:hypothetical protein